MQNFLFAFLPIKFNKSICPDILDVIAHPSFFLLS